MSNSEWHSDQCIGEKAMRENRTVTLSDEDRSLLGFARRCVEHDTPHMLSVHRDAIAVLDRLIGGGK